MAATARDRLIAAASLRRVWKASWPRIKGSTSGIDGITPKQFNDDLTARIRYLRSEVSDGYTFSPLRGVRAPKKNPAKFRIICVPTVQDRLLQRAMLEVFEEKAMLLGISNDVSYGFVKDTATQKRGTFGATANATKHRQIRPWAFKTDITAFFDRIDRGDLLNELRQAFKFSSLMPLVSGAIHCEVDDREPRIQRVLHENGIKKGVGLRQGMPLSPILSNFVLRRFDAAFQDLKLDLVRYADDLVVFCSSQEECEHVRSFVKDQLLKLSHSISDEKTQICPPDEAVEFLGMELGLKSNTGKYVLTVSRKQMEAIRGSFRELHDINNVVSQGLRLPQLLNRLESMKSGYRGAYKEADNYQELSEHLESWSENCITSIYASIFGHEKIEKLNGNQREFLLLTRSI